MSSKQKRQLYRIIASSILLLTAYLVPISIVRFLIFIASYIVVGCSVLVKAVRNMFRGQIFDENFLMSIATIGAFCIGEYSEGVAVMLLYQVGELFEGYAVAKSRRSITELMDIQSDYANVLRDGEVIEVSAASVAVDEIIVIKPGEKVPLDGIVIEGESSLNTCALTGESLPRDVFQGDRVISGCINMNGLLKVRVDSLFEESTASKILRLVEDSSDNKAKSESFITKFARYYTPAVVICAVLIAILPPVILQQSFTQWINRALIFLVLSCPCAVVISVPLSFFGGIGCLAANGILVKGANFIEAISDLNCVVFDKTGTLTRGSFFVTAVHPKRGVLEEELLHISATAESYSDHPISVSLRMACQREIDKSRIGELEEFSGKGIRAVIDGQNVFVGNERLMEDIGVEIVSKCTHTGTTIHVAVEKDYMGHIVISDELKPQTEDALKLLRNQGVKRCIMLTGDRRSVGEETAEKIGIDEVYAELLPEDKVNLFKRILDENGGQGSVAFVGDGINDAPVLSCADIGVAMGGLGSDAAIEAADFVIMDDNLIKLPLAVEISRKTLRIVRQNIVFAFGIKAAVLILGAFGAANMWEAVFADVGVSVIAILNALRVFRINKV